MNHNMQSNVNHTLIQQLLADARRDGLQKLVVGAVIYKNNKFLLLERVPSDSMGGFVGIPSGTVEAREDLLAALTREVQEETGLIVTSVLKYLGSFNWTSSSGKKTRHFNFLVEVEEGEIKLSPTEHQAYYLVSLSIRRSQPLTSQTRLKRFSGLHAQHNTSAWSDQNS